MTLDSELPVSSGVHALVAIARAIERRVPRASELDRRAWKALQPELHETHCLAAHAAEESARALLVEMLDLLLRFRASMGPTPPPS